MEITIKHDGQRVEATQDILWIAQEVKAGTRGTIFWKWVWYKPSDRLGKPTKRNTPGWGSWMPIIRWEKKRDRPGYACQARTFTGLHLI